MDRRVFYITRVLSTRREVYIGKLRYPQVVVALLLPVLPEIEDEPGNEDGSEPREYGIYW